MKLLHATYQMPKLPRLTRHLLLSLLARKSTSRTGNLAARNAKPVFPPIALNDCIELRTHTISYLECFTQICQPPPPMRMMNWERKKIGCLAAASAAPDALLDQDRDSITLAIITCPRLYAIYPLNASN